MVRIRTDGEHVARACDGIEVELLDLGRRRDRRRFLDVSAPLYRHDPHYIEPLRLERMRFLDVRRNSGLRDLEIHALLVRRGRTSVGRVTAHIDHAYDRIHGAGTGWFGFFESTDDRDVAHTLLAAATRWLVAKGAREAIGPMSFNTNHQCGLLVENFDRPPAVDMAYNPPYYERLITSFGFAPMRELYAWWIDHPDPLANPKVARIARIAARVKRREGVTVRCGEMRRFAAECAIIFTIYNHAWCNNWGFVPLNESEFDHLSRALKPIVRPELVLFLEIGGKPVAFAVTVPDINTALPRNGRLLPLGWLRFLLARRRIPHGRLIALGVEPAYQRRGLESLLFVETILRTHALGIPRGEISWTLDDNVLINRAIQSMDGRLDRRYRLFRVALAP